MNSAFPATSANMRPRRLRSLLANALATPEVELDPGKTVALDSVNFRSALPTDSRFGDAPGGSTLDNVATAFQRQLEKHPQFRGRGRLVSSEFHDGVLRLSGCLPSFYLKQQVQALAHRTPGVTRVVNRIDVRDAISRDGELETWGLGKDAGKNPGPPRGPWNERSGE